MAVTDDQYDALINRIEFIEASINRILTALTTLASRDQIRQLSILRQADINSLETRVTSIQNALDTIQELLNL